MSKHHYHKQRKAIKEFMLVFSFIFNDELFIFRAPNRCAINQISITAKNTMKYNPVNFSYLFFYFETLFLLIKTN